jgi:protein-arginine kinase activator protein McsA
MRTFTVECPECDCELDVNIEEADLADLETNHTVVCEECHTETEYAYDPESDELVPVDEEDEGEADTLELIEGDEEEEKLP